MAILNSKVRKAATALVVVAVLAGGAIYLRGPAMAQMMGHMHGGQHGHGMCGFRKFPDSDYGKSRTRISVNPGQRFR